ncbi:MAG: hypothetical protein E7Z67_05930 [Thermoplasmata archaeon]|nr:hypothetical protein [Thermoplasmata archaeon]
MKAEDLRASILQAAVQGRLVPQDPDDEPASVLIERIREEKRRLIKEKRIKADKNESHIYRRDGHWYETINGKDETCIDDDIPFEIPDNWTWSRLRTIGIHVRGKGIKKDEVVAEGLPCIRYGELYTTYNISATNIKSHITQVLFDNVFHINSGDILITLTGENKRDIGKAITYLGRESVAYGGDLLSISSHSLVPLYLSYMLNSESMIIQKSDLATGTQIIHIGAEKVGSLFVPIPPLSEQKRIVQKIEELMPLVEQYDGFEKELTDLEDSFPTDLRASIFQAAVQGRLVPQDPDDEPASVLIERIREEKRRLIREKKIKADKNESHIYRRDGHWYETINGKNEICIDEEIPFDFPTNWEVVRLGSIFNMRSAMRIHQSDWKTTGIPFYRGRELVRLSNDGDASPEIFISEELYLSLKTKGGVPNVGDILISAVGTIGKTYIVQDSKPFYYKDAYILCYENYSRLYSPFFKLMLDSDFLQTQIRADSMATTVSQLTLIKSNRLLCPVPPLLEQKRIVQKIEELLKCIDSMKSVKNNIQNTTSEA